MSENRHPAKIRRSPRDLCSIVTSALVLDSMLTVLSAMLLLLGAVLAVQCSLVKGVFPILNVFQLDFAFDISD